MGSTDDNNKEEQEVMCDGVNFRWYVGTTGWSGHQHHRDIRCSTGACTFSFSFGCCDIVWEGLQIQS